MSGFDTAVLKHFVDVLDKLRRINKHSKSILLVADAQGITIDEFRLQSLYQGFEARNRNIGRTLGSANRLTGRKPRFSALKKPSMQLVRRFNRVYGRAKKVIVQLRVPDESNLARIQILLRKEQGSLLRRDTCLRRPYWPNQPLKHRLDWC